MQLRSWIALALCATACSSKPRLVQVLPPDVRVDVFPQAASAQLDTLFVVDNGDHIRPHQQKVADSFHRFLDYLDKNQIDYHIGLVTTDADNTPGQFQGGGKGYFAAGDSNLAASLASAVVALGDKGSPREAALQQLDLALRNPPQGFLRSSASLFLVAVTDDDDPWSPGQEPNNGPDLYYYRTFKGTKGPGNDALVTFSVIAGAPPKGCSIPDPQNPSNSFVADPAYRLTALAAAMNGVSHSLCDPSFDAVFDQLGATAAGLKRNFRLAKIPDPSTLVVLVRVPCNAPAAALTACGNRSDECKEADPALVCSPPRDVPDGWSYDANTNTILFAGASVPPRGSVVQVQYKERSGAAP